MMTERPKKIKIGETAPTKPRRFVRPWSVTECDGAYEVRDAAGLNLAMVHFEDQPAPPIALEPSIKGRSSPRRSSNRAVAEVAAD